MDNGIAELLNRDRDTLARLTTVDTDEYPHATPKWFLWTSGRFHLTSFTSRPHMARIRANPRVGLVVDIEDNLRPDGERPNKQVRASGQLELSTDIQPRKFHSDLNAQAGTRTFSHCPQLGVANLDS